MNADGVLLLVLAEKQSLLYVKGVSLKSPNFHFGAVLVGKPISSDPSCTRG